MTTRNRRLQPLAKLAGAAALALCAGAETALAQTWDMANGLAPVTNTRRFHGTSGRRNIVRHGNHVFGAVVRQDGAVVIRRKIEGVTVPPNWTTLAIVNNPASGLGSLRPTNNVALAGTDKCLHVTWGRQYYPSYFQQYYRALDYAGTFQSAIQNINTVVGAPATSRTDSMAIAVGRGGEVFLTAPTTSSWRSQLLQSRWIQCPPSTQYANPQWHQRGNISGNAFSSQNVRMVVDLKGLVTMSFYNNSSNGRYATRCFLPFPATTGTWYTMQILTTGPHFHDDDGYLATDDAGMVHVLYKHRLSSSSAATRQLIYHRRPAGIPTGSWGPPNVVYSVPGASLGANNPYGSFALAASRVGAYAIFRDYRCGRFVVRRKKNIEPIGMPFRFIAELGRSSAANDFYRPCVRSTLFANQNRMYQYLDISFTRPQGTTYRLFHNRLQVGAFQVEGNGCTGTCGTPALGYSGVVLSPQPHTLNIDLERARPFGPVPNGVAVLLANFTASAIAPLGSPFFGCTRYVPLAVLDVKLVDTCCTARSTLPLPAGGFPGFFMENQWLIFDTTATGSFLWGNSMSNWGKTRL